MVVEEWSQEPQQQGVKEGVGVAAKRLPMGQGEAVVERRKVAQKLLVHLSEVGEAELVLEVRQYLPGFPFRPSYHQLFHLSID